MQSCETIKTYYRILTVMIRGWERGIVYSETVWLTQAQIVELFQSSKANISEHIKNIYEQEELVESATVRDFRTVPPMGKSGAERIPVEVLFCQPAVGGTGTYRCGAFPEDRLFRPHLVAAGGRHFLRRPDIYRIGASLKDLGKKMFAFSKLEIPVDNITVLL